MQKNKRNELITELSIQSTSIYNPNKVKNFNNKASSVSIAAGDSKYIDTFLSVDKEVVSQANDFVKQAFIDLPEEPLDLYYDPKPTLKLP